MAVFFVKSKGSIKMVNVVFCYYCALYIITMKNEGTVWPIWLNGWSVSPRTKWSWVASLIPTPVGVHAGGNQLLCLSHICSLTPLHSLKISGKISLSEK